MTTRGCFITFEGIDGAGKSTQIDALEHFLRQKGIEVLRTREPGGTPLAEKIRDLLLHDTMNVTTETLLFFASRSEHIHDVIRPALEKGVWVLSDRFTDATFAYQVGAKGYSGEKVEMIERMVQGDLNPDKTVLFDLSPEVAAKRLVKAREADRFEKENIDFFTSVRQAYLDRAKRFSSRFFIVNAELTPDKITAQLLTEAEKWV